MRLFTTLILSLTLIGCGDKATNTGEPVEECGQVLIDAFPADAAAGVYYRSTVEFQLDALVGTEEITVAANGTPVAGTTTDDGKRLVFTPDAPFSASTTYEATLNWDCGPTVTTFTTSDVGDPADTAGLTGLTFGLDLGGGRWVQPAGVGSLVASLLENALLVQVLAADASSMDLKGSISEGAIQDPCAVSFFFPNQADFSTNPYFTVAADELPLFIGGAPVIIEGMNMTGSVASDLSRIEGATLSGTLDASSLDGVMEGDTCELLGTFNVSCEPCDDGTGDHCLTILADNITVLFLLYSISSTSPKKRSMPTLRAPNPRSSVGG